MKRLPLPSEDKSRELDCDGTMGERRDIFIGKRLDWGLLKQLGFWEGLGLKELWIKNGPII